MAQQNKICYRRLKPSDENALIKFIYKQWKLPPGTPELSPFKLLARSYMYQLLKQQDRTYIAAAGSRIIGVIMGRSRQPVSHGSRHVIYPLKYFTQQSAVHALLCLTQNGRGCKELLRCLNSADDALVRSCSTDFDGELTFFMVDRHHRGQGIGTSLLRLLHQYMEHQGVKKIYVLTDTSCDYDFYDRHQFSRLMKKSIELPSDRLKFTCYMYQYTYPS